MPLEKNCLILGMIPSSKHIYDKCIYDICMSEIVTVRVKKSLKEKARKYRINVSKIVRDALEDEVKKREGEELARAISGMKIFLDKIPDNEIVNAIRESRDRR